MIEKKFGSRCCLCLCSHCPQHWYNNTAIQQAVRLGSPLCNFIRGFILYRRGLRYIRKSSCFFLAIKSTIGATVGCIGYIIVFAAMYRMISCEKDDTYSYILINWSSYYILLYLRNSSYCGEILPRLYFWHIMMTRARRLALVLAGSLESS